VQRLPSLTGLRYLAAAMVVFHHAAPVLAAGSWWEHVSAGGYVGVSFFFVLSGFVLAWSHRDADRVSTFYRRRAARVYPLHVITWGAAIAASTLAGDHKTLPSMLLPLFLLQAWSPSVDVYFGANTPSWSLSCEAFFYAVFPLVAHRGPRLATRPRWLVPAVVLMVAVGLGYGSWPAQSQWLSYISPPYRLGEFLIGVLLAAAVRRGMRCVPPVWGALAFVAASYLVVAVVLPDRSHGFHDAVMLPSIVVLLAAAARADIAGVRTLWSSKVLVRLGTWSFALYLINFAAVRLLERLIGGPMDNGPVLGPLLTIVWLVALVAPSWLAYRVIEEPGERWLSGRRRRPTAIPAVR
jgi:peptidoglycan/LPS O-acetylase OafA/YrhL